MARKVPVGVSALKQDYPIKNGTVVATLIGWKINLENLYNVKFHSLTVIK